MKVTAAIQKRVKAKLAEGIALAEKHYKRKFIMPVISFKLRGMCAGKANYMQWHVKFNPVLLTENLEDFLERTVPHELAHLIAFSVHPESLNGGGWSLLRKKREVHGWQWQSVMRVLGVTGDQATRCHSYDTTNAKVQKKNSRNVQYKCMAPGCGTILSIGPKNHRRLQNDCRALWHRGCKGYGLVLASTSTLPVHATIYIPKPQAALAPGAGTKMERALAMCRANPTEARLNMIARFISELGMTRAGATTYYYTVSKKIT